MRNRRGLCLLDSLEGALFRVLLNKRLFRRASGFGAAVRRSHHIMLTKSVTAPRYACTSPGVFR